MSDLQKAQCPAATGQSARQITNALIVADAAEQRKRAATLVAKLALRGHAVHTTAEGGFLVCWHSYVRHCPDIVALEAFAKQVGAL